LTDFLAIELSLAEVVEKGAAAPIRNPEKERESEAETALLVDGLARHRRLFGADIFSMHRLDIFLAQLSIGKVV